MAAYTAAFGLTGKRAETSRRGDVPVAPLLMAVRSSALDGVTSLPVLVLGGHENVRFPTNRAAQESADRMRQPAGNFH